MAPDLPCLVFNTQNPGDLFSRRDQFVRKKTQNYHEETTEISWCELGQWDREAIRQIVMAGRAEEEKNLRKILRPFTRGEP